MPLMSNAQSLINMVEISTDREAPAFEWPPVLYKVTKGTRFTELHFLHKYPHHPAGQYAVYIDQANGLPDRVWSKALDTYGKTKIEALECDFIAAQREAEAARDRLHEFLLETHEFWATEGRLLEADKQKLKNLGITLHAGRWYKPKEPAE